MRTTLDLDPLILRELKERQKVEQKSLGQLVSELLAPVLAQPAAPSAEFHWATAPMGAMVNLEDKAAVWAVLDAE